MNNCSICGAPGNIVAECDCGEKTKCCNCCWETLPRCPCGDGPDLMAPSFQERYEQAAEQKRRLR